MSQAAILTILAWSAAIAPRDKLVLVHLVRSADGSGLVAPIVGTAARATGYDRRTVQGALRALEGAGLVRRVGGSGRGRANTYELFPVKQRPEAAA